MMRAVRAFLISFFTVLSALAGEPTHRIGVIIPLTGNLANYGATVRQSIEKVRVPGIQWVFEDEACETATTISAFKKLSDVDGISFIIGPCCGSPQKALAPLLKKQKRLVVLPNAASESVFESSGHSMYSVQYSVDTEASFLAEQMNRRGLKKVAIISVDSDFSRTMESNFVKTFQGKVVYSFHAPGHDAQYMKAAALRLKSADFDSIFLADISPLFLGFLSELRKLGIAQKPAFTNYGAQMPDIITSEKENAEGLMYSYPDVPDTEDAFGFFPNVAAKLLAETVRTCEGNYECVADAFKANPAIGKDGTLAGKIILKKIENRKYVRVVN